MEASEPLRSAANQQGDVTISRQEYDDENILVIDFGPGVDTTLDIVGDTAIVVAGDRQFEFEIPADATKVTTNNGMPIIEE